MNLLCKPLTLAETSRLTQHLHKEICHWKVGRDGRYCYGEETWFELNGRAYELHRPGERARVQFKNEFTVNDEAILSPSQVAALEVLIGTLRKGELKKSLQKRLQLHKDAVYWRGSSRQGKASFHRVTKKWKILQRNKSDTEDNA